MFRAASALLAIPDLMDSFHHLAVKLFVFLGMQISYVEGVAYGAVWVNGNQKLTILCPDDDTKPARMFIANGPCASVPFVQHFIQEINARDMIPDGVDPDGLGYIVFPPTGDIGSLDVGNEMEYDGEAFDHDYAAELYDYTKCEE